MPETAKRDWVSNPPENLEDYDLLYKEYISEYEDVRDGASFQEISKQMEKFSKGKILCEFCQNKIDGSFLIGYRPLLEEDVLKKQKEEEAKKKKLEDAELAKKELPGKIKELEGYLNEVFSRSTEENDSISDEVDEIVKQKEDKMTEKELEVKREGYQTKKSFKTTCPKCGMLTMVDGDPPIHTTRKITLIQPGPRGTVYKTSVGTKYEMLCNKCSVSKNKQEKKSIIDLFCEGYFALTDTYEDNLFFWGALRESMKDEGLCHEDMMDMIEIFVTNTTASAIWEEAIDNGYECFFWDALKIALKDLEDEIEENIIELEETTDDMPDYIEELESKIVKIVSIAAELDRHNAWDDNENCVGEYKKGCRECSEGNECDCDDEEYDCIKTEEGKSPKYFHTYVRHHQHLFPGKKLTVKDYEKHIKDYREKYAEGIHRYNTNPDRIVVDNKDEKDGDTMNKFEKDTNSLVSFKEFDQAKLNKVMKDNKVIANRIAHYILENENEEMAKQVKEAMLGSATLYDEVIAEKDVKAIRAEMEEKRKESAEKGYSKRKEWLRDHPECKSCVSFNMEDETLPPFDYRTPKQPPLAEEVLVSSKNVMEEEKPFSNNKAGSPFHGYKADFMGTVDITDECNKDWELKSSKKDDNKKRLWNKYGKLMEKSIKVLAEYAKYDPSILSLSEEELTNKLKTAKNKNKVTEKLNRGYYEDKVYFKDQKKNEENEEKEVKTNKELAEVYLKNHEKSEAKKKLSDIRDRELAKHETPYLSNRPLIMRAERIIEIANDILRDISKQRKDSFYLVVAKSDFEIKENFCLNDSFYLFVTAYEDDGCAWNLEKKTSYGWPFNALNYTIKNMDEFSGLNGILSEATFKLREIVPESVYLLPIALKSQGKNKPVEKLNEINEYCKNKKESLSKDRVTVERYLEISAIANDILKGFSKQGEDVCLVANKGDYKNKSGDLFLFVTSYENDGCSWILKKKVFENSSDFIKVLYDATAKLKERIPETVYLVPSID